LVHKISAYKYIYENGKKKWEKKRVFLLAGPGGDFGPSGRERAGAVGGPLGPSVGETTPWHEPTRQREEEGLMARSGDGGGGEVDRGSPAGEILRRFSAVGPVLWWGSGGEARVVVGGHGGGVNSTGGDLGWQVHIAVASARGGEVTGEAAEHNRRWGWVHRDCE
jgi:hypothetical protein